jgi:hypothetical protein
MNNTYDFNEKGYVFLKKIYSIDTIEEFNKDVRDFLTKNNIYGHLKKREDVIEENFFVNNTYTSLDNYKKMQYYYLPVVDNKSSHNRTTDAGMIDIYNIDKLFPNLFKLFDINLMLILLNKLTNTKWKLLRSNLQICSNVENPMSYHFENCEKCIKYVIYLSDINSNDDGPPSLIENTHLVKNEIKNSHIKMFCGQKGDTLISYQSILHRKMPQKNSTIGFLVFNFVCI